MRVLFIGVAVLVLLLLLATLLHSPPNEWSRAQSLALQLQQLGIVGIAAFALITALATSIGLPRQLFAFIGGYAYGTLVSLLLSSVAAIVGCAITFFIARHFLARRVSTRYPKIVAWLNNAIDKDTFLKIIILRLQPLGTNLITNVCAGVSNISLPIFLASSWLGYLPQMLVFALLGAGLRINSSTHLIISLVLTAVSFVLGTVVYRRYRISLSP